MAEPLGTNDIEDVVSSVRRLVSPEARSRPVSRDLGADRLLLTPSLRVVADPQAAEGPPIPDPLVLTRPLEDTKPGPDDVAAAEGALPTEPKAADAAEVAVQPVPTADLEEASLHVVEGEWEDAFWSEEEPALAELALAVEEAELVAQEPEPWAQNGSDWSEPEEDLRPTAEAEPADATSDERIAASVLPFPQSDEPTRPIDSLAGLTDADGNPVTVLDEAALNEMVRALIREELQGVLGERITQSVRKLVRAEINKALTARALD